MRRFARALLDRGADPALRDEFGHKEGRVAAQRALEKWPIPPGAQSRIRLRE